MKSSMLKLVLGAFVVLGMAASVSHAQEQKQAVPTPDPVVQQMRQMILGLAPTDIGLPGQPMHPRVWGVMMDIGYQSTLASLVVLADGTTSLYLGHGGGVIGAGQFKPVRDAAVELLQLAEIHKNAVNAVPLDSASLPMVGEVKFHLLTYDGAITVSVDQDELGHNRHRLSGMFHTGHEVIARIHNSTQMQQLAGR